MHVARQRRRPQIIIFAAWFVARGGPTTGQRLRDARECACEGQVETECVPRTDYNNTKTGQGQEYSVRKVRDYKQGNKRARTAFDL